ncbi:MAG: DUF2225 domain-containing protein [Proteobacteria bacterium]|nr:DUF2225 domain-containing protein [Pseudomonadota bacterium]MCP4916775.1 DUF2225 domain-containing protein [Pseudomonadota bacterium]
MWLLALSSVFATQISYTAVECPVGPGSMRVYEKVTSNALGGWDSDLARYSSEGQWREYAVATCAESLYSVYAADVGLELTARQVTALEKKLAELRPQLPGVEQITVWDRYLVAAEMYRLLDKDPMFIGTLYLEASWVARDVAVGEYAGLEGPDGARELLDAGAAELDKDLSPRMRKIVLHNLARVAHRGGFPAERDAFLDAFEAVGDLDADERRVLTEFRHITGEVEPKLQELALRELKKVEDTKASASDKARAAYLIADLDRRRGRTEQARKAFGAVAQDPNAQPELRELAEWLADNG